MAKQQKHKRDQQQNGASKQEFVIQKVYVKDISFETPNSPDVFTQKWEPQIDLELSTAGKGLSRDVHEVVLTITISAKLSEKTAYLVEAQQAGIFTIRGFNAQELAHALGSYCPNILFPFARELISDLITKGGFPQLLLTPVNFDTLFSQHVQRLQQEGKESGPIH